MTGPPLAVGVDVASVDRVADALGDADGDGFEDRAFTADEVAYCRSRADPPQHFAARWAAKEAAVKALPDADAGTVSVSDVAVERDGDERVLALSGAALAAREAFAPDAATSVSLAHDRRTGVAAAVVALATDARTAETCVEAADLDGALAAAGIDGEIGDRDEDGRADAADGTDATGDTAPGGDR